MMRIGRPVIFEEISASWIFTLRSERGCVLAGETTFCKRALYSKICCYRSSIQTNPLMAMTNFYIPVIFNTGNCRINDIIIENILSIVRSLLCKNGIYSKKQKQHG